ncbi:MAG TPA: hypothetical protein VFY56_08630 [Propionibacteriaceae bacterium]|nr:hypothetical protein [Propionibacteriaceae bacterium]
MPHVDVVGPGSGEGIGHLFQAWSNAVKRLIPIRQAAILNAAEVSTLNAMKARRASTLFPELNKAWMGEPLGFAYVAKEKSLKIEEGPEGRIPQIPWLAAHRQQPLAIPQRHRRVVRQRRRHPASRRPRRFAMITAKADAAYERINRALITIAAAGWRID